MNVKGVSGVVTAVLLILLVIGAISILWVVVGNFVKQGAESIELGVNTLKLDIKSASFVQDNLEISVERGGVKGNVSGVRIVLEDASGKAVAFENPTNFLEFETKTITITSNAIIDEGLDSGSLVKISVYPTITSSEGKIFEGTVEDQIQIVDGEVIIDNVPTTPISDVTTGLVAHYSFDSDLSDSSGNGNDGNCDGRNDREDEEENEDFTCPTSINGRFGQARSFDGISNAFQVSNNDIPGSIFINSYSITGWFKPNSLIENDALVQKRGGHDFIIGTWETKGKLGYMFGRDIAGDRQWLFNQEVLVMGQWYHFTAIYNSTTNIGSLYLNGIFQESGNTEPLTNPPATNLAIGSPPDGSTTGWMFANSSIDEVRIYDRVLTQEEISYLFQFN